MSINTEPRTNPKTPVFYQGRSRPILSIYGLFKAGIMLVVLGIFSPFWVPLLGSAISFLQPTHEVTVERLLQQARGEQFYWHEDGQAWSNWQALNTRHPKRRAREEAIKKLSEFQPLPINARNGLIDLLQNGESDFDSGDGIYSFRSTICCALGRSAHHWSAYEAMFEVLKKRALHPELDSESPIKWFDESWGHYGDSYTGPAGIIRGLRFTPIDQHVEIAKRLETLLEELESTPVRSDWAVLEIKSGLKFLQGESKDVDWEIERHCKSDW